MTLRIFDRQIARKPNLYPWASDLKRDMQHTFWTDQEFDFLQDINDFKSLPKSYQTAVVRGLSAIAQIEVKVKTFWAKLGETFPHPAIHDLGITMANQEVIHGDAYDRLLETLGMEDIYNQNLQLPILNRRLAYLEKYLSRKYDDEKLQKVYAVALFTLYIENVSLFGQFYILRNIHRKFKKLKDMDQQISYTMIEEKAHGDVGTHVVNTIRREYPELGVNNNIGPRILQEARESLLVEHDIVDWILEETDEDREEVKNYLANRMNNGLIDMGFEAVAEVDSELLKNPLGWML